MTMSWGRALEMRLTLLKCVHLHTYIPKVCVSTEKFMYFGSLYIARF